jgi:5,10-methylenetetrahydrofolate reductase
MSRKISFLTKMIVIAIFCGTVAVSAGSGSELVDDYEKFVVRLIETGKKMQAGDQAAVTQMMELVTEALQWAQRLEAEAADLTPGQAARLKMLGEKAAEALVAE